MQPGKAIVALALVMAAGIPMSATAAAPAASVAPSSLVFGAQNPAGPYPPQSVTLTNSGTAPLTLAAQRGKVTILHFWTFG